jgi:hypothetical protein
MLKEAPLKEVAKRRGDYAYVIDKIGSKKKVKRSVSPEVFVGARVIDAICTYARERTARKVQRTQ